MNNSQKIVLGSRIFLLLLIRTEGKVVYGAAEDKYEQ